MGKTIANWVRASEAKPEVDQTSDWNKKHQISKDVLCYTPEWGKKFGRYFHLADMWTVDGVTDSRGVRVEYWTEIEDPK